MEFFLQFKSDRNDCFQTVQVEFKEKPLRHHLLGLQYTASGYGNKLPSIYMIHYENRWYRVYSICYSNVSTEYVIIMGKRIRLIDRKSTRLNSSHLGRSRMPSSA